MSPQARTAKGKGVAERGPGGLRVLLAADCPHIRSAEITNRCGVHFPELPRLFLAPPKR